MALALELALLQGNPNGIEGGHHHQQHNHHHHQSHAATAGGGGSSNGHPQLQHANSANFPMGHHESSCGGGGGVGGSGLLLNGFGNSGSLEDLKVGRRSQNMTECVPVPTSEHVAEIVGRQGELINGAFLCRGQIIGERCAIRVMISSLGDVLNPARNIDFLSFFFLLVSGPPFLPLSTPPPSPVSTLLATP